MSVGPGLSVCSVVPLELQDPLPSGRELRRCWGGWGSPSEEVASLALGRRSRVCVWPRPGVATAGAWSVGVCWLLLTGLGGERGGEKPRA